MRLMLAGHKRQKDPFLGITEEDLVYQTMKILTFHSQSLLAFWIILRSITVNYSFALLSLGAPLAADCYNCHQQKVSVNCERCLLPLYCGRGCCERHQSRHAPLCRLVAEQYRIHVKAISRFGPNSVEFITPHPSLPKKKTTHHLFLSYHTV